MKTVTKWALTVITMALTNAVLAQSEPIDEQAIYAELRLQMARACPVLWEDLGASMDTATLNGDIWVSNTADRAQFIVLMQEIMSDATSAELDVMADDMATVATECASHRVALLDALISKTPRDVLLAMDAVNLGLNKSIEYLDGGWSVGDVRVTGRLDAQDGWVFLIGQTIGNENTAATLVGEEYNELFELAKNWAPNTGTEDWDAGHLVTLPDMRGRGLFGADNMGGNSANRLTAANAGKIGGSFGSEKVTISTSQMPSHAHGMNTKGNHSHYMGYAGTHKHSLKTSAYDGGNVGTVSYMTGKGRTNVQNTIVSSVQNAGNHKHSIGSAGNHTHTVTATGGSTPLTTVSPGIVFNVEMKY